MDLVSGLILFIFVAMAVVGLILMFATKKKEVGAVLTAIGVLLLAGAILIAPATVGLGTTTGEKVIPTGLAVPIKQLNGTVTEDFSNSTSNFSGTIYLYAAGSDPSAANTTPKVSITVTSGDFNDVSGKILTETPYRIVLDGSGYYSADLGEVYFPYANYDNQTGLYYWDFGNPTTGSIVKAQKTVTFETLLLADATQSGASDSNTVGNDVNEVITDGSGGIIYDESAGDQTFTVRIKIGATGANSVGRDVVVGYDFDQTNSPEGNEVTDITVTPVSGTQFAEINSNTLGVNAWSSENHASLGEVKGGTSGTYDLTFTVDESNLDTGDVFYVYVDDLGGSLEKDVLNNRRATQVKFAVSNQA